MFMFQTFVSFLQLQWSPLAIITSVSKPKINVSIRSRVSPRVQVLHPLPVQERVHHEHGQPGVVRGADHGGAGDQ